MCAPGPTHASRSLDDVGRKAMRMRVEAKQEERAALAERFEFLNLHHLSANISVSRPRWGWVHGCGFGWVVLVVVVGNLCIQFAHTAQTVPYPYCIITTARCWRRARCRHRWTGTAW